MAPGEFSSTAVAKGKHESEWEAMFINRPAKGGKRAEYPNE